MNDAAGTNLDRAGRVEAAGVEYIPEAARTSSPRNMFVVFVGANLCFPSIIFGWLPVLYGLGFWGSLSSAAVGYAVATLAVLPVALVGPRTGTNATVSSGAEFGIRGRFLGSALTFVYALIFAAVSVWTSGDALLTVAHRLFGLPQNDGSRAVGYAVIAAIIVVVAVLGHGTIIAAQKWVLPVSGVMMLLGFVAFAPHVSLEGHVHEYLLGGYWPTWVLSAVISASGPIAYATNVGDYTRRIAAGRYSDRAVMGAFAAALFLGEMFPNLFGTFTATAFVQPTDSYASDLVSLAPGWYIAPLLIIALAGGLGQGILCIYSSALDLSALLPRLSRAATTVLTSCVALALLYLGAFVFDIVASITSLTLVLNVLAAPWIAVIAIGLARRRRRGFAYDPFELQAFVTGRRGGRYWYHRGWNPVAFAAWAAGALWGLLAVDATPLFTAPLAELADGIDLSLVGSVVVTTTVYLCGLRLLPRQVDGPEPGDQEPATTHVERSHDARPELPLA